MAPSATTYQPVLPAFPPVTCNEKSLGLGDPQALPDTVPTQGGAQSPYAAGTRRVDELQLRTHSSSDQRQSASGSKSMERPENECEEEFDSPSLKQAPSSASLCSWDGSSLSASSVSGDTPMTSDCDSSDSSSPFASPAGYLSLSPLRGVSPTSPAANWTGSSAASDTEAAIAVLARNAGLAGLRRYDSEVDAEGKEEEEDEEENNTCEESVLKKTSPVVERTGRTAGVLNGEKAVRCSDVQAGETVTERIDPRSIDCIDGRNSIALEAELPRDRNQPRGAWSAKSALEDGKAAVAAARTGDVPALKEILARQPSVIHTRSHLVWNCSNVEMYRKTIVKGRKCK